MDADKPPNPDDPDYTAALHKRRRADSGSSTSLEESCHSTRSIRSEDFEFVTENGRLYGNETYYLPCDQAEQDRLAIQHQVFLHALKGKLTTTPITRSTRRILDLGTGPGDWAVAIAKQCPHAEVVGIDLSVWDIETTADEPGAENVSWEIDDLDVWGPETPDLEDLSSMVERYDPFRDPTHRGPSRAKRKEEYSQSPSHSQPQSQPLTPLISEPPPPSFAASLDLDQDPLPGWNFSEPFDLIHARNMKAAFTHWEEVYAEIYKNLRPGGYVEIVDYEVQLPDMLKPASSTSAQFQPQPSDGPNSSTTNDDSAYALPTCRKLYLLMMSASFRAGRPLGTFYLHPSYLSDAGFKDVRTTYVNIPIGQWSEDPVQKQLGKMFLVVLMESFEANVLRLATRWAGMGEGEVMELIEEGKRELLEWNEGCERGNGGGKGKGQGGGGEEWCATFKWVVGRKP